MFQVSVLLLKMNEVNCAIEARGDDLSVALQVMNVVPEQLNNVGMWQYLRGCVGKALAFTTGSCASCSQGIFCSNFSVHKAEVPVQSSCVVSSTVKPSSFMEVFKFLLECMKSAKRGIKLPRETPNYPCLRITLLGWGTSLQMCSNFKETNKWKAQEQLQPKPSECKHAQLGCYLSMLSVTTRGQSE